MARILFAWEHGTAFGHALSCASLARALEMNGHTPAFVFRELQSLAALNECAHYDAFQAPMSLYEGEGAPPPLSFADILLGCGYGDVRTLTGLLEGWIRILERWRPDLVVADSAPTALVAARILRIRRATYSNGFALPPRVSPLPAFRRDVAVDPAALAASDARALAHVNQAIAAFRGEPLQALEQLFEADETFLCTFPEIDHYGARPASAYWGPRFKVDAGDDVKWSYGEGRRVLVYVRDVVPQLDALIDALVANRCRVAAFIPNLDPARRERLQSAQRIVAQRQMRLAPLLAQCDLFVSEGGNIATGALLSGVPQLLFPTQYEQLLTAARLEQLGSALWVPPGSAPERTAMALRRMLQEPRFKASAQTFARRYPGFSPAEQQRRIVLRIDEILARPIISPTTRTGTAP